MPSPDTADRRSLLRRSASAPTAEEVARVDAWRAEIARLAAERDQAASLRRSCSLHGPGPTGRMLYGKAPYGYGPVCKFCRKEWSRRNGKRWYSEAELRAMKRAAHDAMVAEVEAMPPTEFYAAWAALRATRHEETRGYHREAVPDEYGVNSFGSATPDGERYIAMRARVRREVRVHEEARDVV